MTTQSELATAFAECVLAEVRWPCRRLCRLEGNVVVVTRPSATGRKVSTARFIPRGNVVVVQFSGSPRTVANSTSTLHGLEDPTAVSAVAYMIRRRLFWPLAHSLSLYASFVSNCYAAYSLLTAPDAGVRLWGLLHLLWVAVCAGYCLRYYLAWLFALLLKRRTIGL